MAEKPEDIQLKFNGAPVERLDGAPADTVIASLQALQRMVYIIGMRTEGRSLSERVKPTAKVRRDYAIVCKAPKHGSHIQPFNVASERGVFTPAALGAREKLLKALKAFDSGEEEKVEQVLSNPRERYFMARAALGLLPPKDSGIDVTLRAGNHGPFSFKAERARELLSRYEKQEPPDVDVDLVAGKLQTIDFTRTIVSIKPSHDPVIRTDYPMSMETFLTANVRKRLIFAGKPKLNQKGDISSFDRIDNVSETEASLEPITQFETEHGIVRAVRPLSILLKVDWQDRLFVFQDEQLGIDAFATNYADMRQSILDDLAVLWENYVLIEDDKLDPEARAVKIALKNRFRAAS